MVLNIIKPEKSSKFQQKKFAVAFCLGVGQKFCHRVGISANRIAIREGIDVKLRSDWTRIAWPGLHYKRLDRERTKIQSF